MKSLLQSFLLFNVLFASPTFAQVFYNINESWNTKNAITNNYDAIDSQMDSNKGVVTVGSEFVSDEGSNALIQYIDNLGTLVWVISYDFQGHDDYATSVFIDQQDNIFVSGVAYDPVSMDYDFLVLKINSNGQIMNSTTVDYGSGKNNYAADIQSRNGNIYVTGTVENSQTDYDMLTICVNSQFQLSWASTYDHLNGYDIGAKIGLYSSGIMVSGGSGTAFDDWEFTAVKYNYSGTQGGAVQTANGASQFSSPSSMITQEDGSTTILGQITNGQGNLDVTIIKLDENLSTMWQYDYDYQGMDDVGTNIILEPNGDYALSGWVTEQTGQIKGLLLKLSGSGSLVYARKITAGSRITNDLKAMAIKTHMGEIYIAGAIETTEGNGVAVYKTKSNGQVIWSYFGELNDEFRVSSIDVIDSTKVKVSGLTLENGYTKYLTLELKTLMREHVVSSGSGMPHAQNQIMVRFKPEYLDSLFIYDSRKVFATLDQMLTPVGLSKFENCIGKIMKDYSGVKVHKGLTPRNQYSLTRQGDTIPIPQFWTSMVILVDNSFDLDSTITILNACNDVVLVAQKNFKYEISDCVAQDFLESLGEDYGWFLDEEDEHFHSQKSINTPSLQNGLGAYDSDNDGWVDGNIKTVDAWCFSVGRNDIIVGVIDDKIDFLHEDLRDEENGYIISGWDFFQNTVINEESLAGGEDHGTKVAGIIGALRNNGKGVVGIAGGDYRALEQDWLENDGFVQEFDQAEIELGVQLNSYSVGQGASIFTEQASEALVMAVTNDFEEDWEDACHIINNSWGTTQENLNSQWRLEEEFDFEVATGYWFANRNGVINFTARGNRTPNNPNTNRVVYPACYYDHWSVSVGASGVSGKSSAGSLYGNNLDVLGPETTALNPNVWGIFTTDLDIGQSTPYDNFNGSSSGTPHAAGIGALMLSYFNLPFASPENLLPSDVENLIEMSARNFEVDGTYTDPEGWGLVQSTAALELLEEPNYELLHFQEDFVASDLQLVDDDLNVTIPIVSGDGLGIPEGEYTVDKYMIEETVFFPVPNNFIPTGSWTNPELTNCLLDTHTEGNTEYLFLDEHSTISDLSSLANGQVTLQTFVYHIVSDGQGTNIDVWLPSGSTYSIPYTVHYIDNTPIHIQEESPDEIFVYPNPTSDYLSVGEINNISSMSYSIISIDGAIVKEGQISGKINVSLLSSGLYIIRLNSGNSWHSYKFLKK